MFETIGDFLTQGRTLAALVFILVIIVSAVVVWWQSKSAPKGIGVLIAGVIALAIMVQMDTLALKVGGELDGTNKTTADTGNFQVVKEFGG